MTGNLWQCEHTFIFTIIHIFIQSSSLSTFLFSSKFCISKFPHRNPCPTPFQWYVLFNSLVRTIFKFASLEQRKKKYFFIHYFDNWCDRSNYSNKFTFSMANKTFSLSLTNTGLKFCALLWKIISFGCIPKMRTWRSFGSLGWWRDRFYIKPIFQIIFNIDGNLFFSLEIDFRAFLLISQIVFVYRIWEFSMSVFTGYSE